MPPPTRAPTQHTRRRGSRLHHPANLRAQGTDVLRIGLLGSPGKALGVYRERAVDSPMAQLDRERVKRVALSVEDVLGQARLDAFEQSLEEGFRLRRERETALGSSLQEKPGRQEDEERGTGGDEGFIGSATRLQPWEGGGDGVQAVGDRRGDALRATDLEERRPGCA